MEVNGKIIEVCPIQEGTSKAGNPWKKRLYVLETQDNYPKKVAFTVFGSERVDQYNDKIMAGMNVRVSFDLESREFNGRWYTDATAWRIEVAGEGTAQGAAPTNIPPMDNSGFGNGAFPPPPAGPANSLDDLPF